jgi:phage gpG-like protein
MKFFDPTKDIVKEVNLAIEKVTFNSQAYVIQEFTKFPNPPIKSGQLRQSIRAEYSNGSGKVTANKEYALFIEYGTIKMVPRPYMRNGIKRAEESNMKIIQNTLANL